MNDSLFFLADRDTRISILRSIIEPINFYPLESRYVDKNYKKGKGVKVPLTMYNDLCKLSRIYDCSFEFRHYGDLGVTMYFLLGVVLHLFVATLNNAQTHYLTATSK